MAWLMDWFSVTDKKLQRWREQGQLQRLADVLRDDRHRALHRVALRELGIALAADTSSGPPSSKAPAYAELLADWAEREPDSSLPSLRQILPKVPQGTRSRIVARLAAFHTGRRWLSETFLDPVFPAEAATELLRGLAPRPEDLESIPRSVASDARRSDRMMQLGRAVISGPDSNRLLRKLLESHGALREVGVELSREHVERLVGGSRELSAEELGLAVEVGRRDQSWIEKLLARTEKPSALVPLALAASRELAEPRKAIDSLVGLYRKLPAESPARAEILPRLRELSAPAAVWIEVYHVSGPSLRPIALEALLEAGQLGALSADALRRLLLDEQGQPERFAQILEAVRGAGRVDVLQAAYSDATPFARAALFSALQGSAGARFFETILHDRSEVADRRIFAARRLLDATGEHGMRQLLDRAGPEHAGELRQQLLAVYLAEDTPAPAAKTLAILVSPVTEADLHSELVGKPRAGGRSEERRQELVRQFAAGVDGASTLLRLMTENAGQPQHAAILAIARRRLEERVQKADSAPLDQDEMAMLQELARRDLSWFNDLFRRSRAKSVLIDAAIEVAWRLPQSQNPIDLLVGFYKHGSGDSERRKILKALIRHRAGVETYVDVYGASAANARKRGPDARDSREPSLRHRILKMLEEHPRASEIPRDFLIQTLLNEMSDKNARASLLHILERRGEMTLLEDVYAGAGSRDRAAVFDLVSETPAIRDTFYERVLLDRTEDAKRRLGAAIRLSNNRGRGGLSRLLESQEPKHADEVRHWLVDRYLNRATPTLEASALLKALAPAQPRDIEGVLDAATSARAFEGRLLELGRAAAERPGGVPVLLRLVREGDETLRSVAEVLALEHLEQRAVKGRDGQFEGEDLSLAIELGSVYKDWLAQLVARVERPKSVLELVLKVVERSGGTRVRGLLAALWRRPDLDAASRHRILAAMAEVEIGPEVYLELYGSSDSDSAEMVKGEIQRRYPEFELPPPPKASETELGLEDRTEPGMESVDVPEPTLAPNVQPETPPPTETTAAADTTEELQAAPAEAEKVGPEAEMEVSGPYEAPVEAREPTGRSMAIEESPPEGVGVAEEAQAWSEELVSVPPAVESGTTGQGVAVPVGAVDLESVGLEPAGDPIAHLEGRSDEEGRAEAADASLAETEELHPPEHSELALQAQSERGQPAQAESRNGEDGKTDEDEQPESSASY